MAGDRRPDVSARPTGSSCPARARSPTAPRALPRRRVCGRDRDGDEPRHAVPGHLRRHAADGRAWAGARGHPRFRLDQGRRRGDAGTRSAPAADGLERAGFRARRASAAGRAGTRRPRLFRAQLRAGRRRAGRNHRDHRVRRHRSGHGRAGNRAGTQFHVEKSQDVGLRLLANFLRWTP